MFAVGEIRTTHVQWTIGEFTYAYMRILQAARSKDYLVTHVSDAGFKLYLPPSEIKLTISHANPVPVRIAVAHAMGLTPRDMTTEGFGVVAKMIMVGCTKELAVRCPRKGHCLCSVDSLLGGSKCGRQMGRQEFLIDGMIAN